MNKALDRIKTIFWCRDIFRRIGIEKASQLELNAQNKTLHSLLSKKYEGEKNKQFTELFLSGQDGPAWIKYYEGRTVPSEKSNGRKGNRPIRTLVEEFFNITSNYFNNGPYDVFKVFEVEIFSDAVFCLIESCQAFNESVDLTSEPFKTINFGRITWDDNVQKLLTNNLGFNIGKISSFLRFYVNHNYDDHNEDLILLAIAAAYIETKYLHKELGLITILEKDPLFLERTNGLEFMQKKFGINTNIWFNEL